VVLEMTARQVEDGGFNNAMAVADDDLSLKAGAEITSFDSVIKMLGHSKDQHVAKASGTCSLVCVK